MEVGGKGFQPDSKDHRFTSGSCKCGVEERDEEEEQCGGSPFGETWQDGLHPRNWFKKKRACAVHVQVEIHVAAEAGNKVDPE